MERLSFADQFAEAAMSNQSGVWVTTDDYHSAQSAIVQRAFKNVSNVKRQVWIFSPSDGVTIYEGTKTPGEFSPLSDAQQGPGDRFEPGFMKVVERLRKESNPDTIVFCLIHDMHTWQTKWFPLVREALRTIQVNHGMLIGLAPPSKTPSEELRPLFWIIPYELPDEAELYEIAVESRDKSKNDAVKKHSDEHLKKCATALKGLTREQSARTLVRSAVRKSIGCYDPKFLWEAKCESISEGGRLEIRQLGLTRKDVVGLAGVLDFSTDVLRRSEEKRKAGHTLLRSRGLMLCGVAGAGKSLVADVLGGEAGWPTARMNIGAMFDKYVGDTETNVRETLRIAERLAPVILQVDEFEKVMPTANAEGGSGDVGRRLLGAFLTWWNDCTEPVYIVATVNDSSGLSGPILRRFDGCYFFDLPSVSAQRAGWELYLRKYGPAGASAERDKPWPSTPDWNIADIEKCVRLSAITGRTVQDMALSIAPVGKVSKGEISAMRSVAVDTYLDADSGGIYKGPPPRPGKAAATGSARRESATI